MQTERSYPYELVWLSNSFSAQNGLCVSDLCVPKLQHEQNSNEMISKILHPEFYLQEWSSFFVSMNILNCKCWKTTKQPFKARW